MEVFFKNLTPEEGAAGELLHDISLAKEHAEELFEVAGASLARETKVKFLTSVERVKVACRDMQTKAVAGAKAADRVMHEHPYSVAGVAFGLGLVIGALVLRKSSSDELVDAS